MILRTLGRFTLDGSDFRRAKPLLLATYLTLEGAKPRRYLAEIFWPGASDAMNSLSVALSQLRRGAPGSVEADEARSWSLLRCDAVDLRSALSSGQHERAAAIYEGAFLEGLDLELGEELEEWLYSVRETLAAGAREALVRLAELKAGQGRFEQAGVLAERAYSLPGAAPLEPEELIRFQVLLSAAKSPLLTELRREAESFEIALRLTPEEARARLGQLLLGRENELEVLRGLAPGEWAWLRGESGMGKTAVLKQLAGAYLPARSGLPYATLEPLLGDLLGESESALLRRLAGMTGVWLLDDWERMDEESTLLLSRLRFLRPAVIVIIASREPAAIQVDREVVLGPLPGGALGSYPDAWEQTGGLPELVEAFIREEPVETALERQLARFDEPTRRVYLGLALLDEPDAALVRRALHLDGATMAATLDTLQAAGLIEPGATVRARQSALHYLESRPALAGPLALSLARQLRGIGAFPLYHRSRAFWEIGDQEDVSASYRAWAEELLRRGFARRAADILAEAPPSQVTTMLWARALERAGQYKEALTKLASLSSSPLVSGLQSALYWRLGRPDEARLAASEALEGHESEARAEALNTLGVLARSEGDFQDAASYARRSAALWRAAGNQGGWVGALNNLGIARVEAGDVAGGEPFAEALAAAGDSDLLKARTLLNVGWLREREEELEGAENAYREAARLAAEAGVIEVAAWAWNNLGVLHHKQGRKDAATQAYERALSLAQRAGEQRILGMVMANLAELTEDADAWEEALRILENAGHGPIAASFRKALPEGHVFGRRDRGVTPG